MLLNRPLLACLLALLGQVALGAPMPRLDKAAPTLCTVSSSNEWAVNAAQAAAVEKALPAYFASLKAHSSQLPAGMHVYARQYSGITRDGKPRIHARFYPANDPAIAQMKPGSCWWTSDGGNAYWSVEFDPETGAIIGFSVNGIA